MANFALPLIPRPHVGRRARLQGTTQFPEEELEEITNERDRSPCLENGVRDGDLTLEPSFVSTPFELSREHLQDAQYPLASTRMWAEGDQRFYEAPEQRLNYYRESRPVH